MAPVGFVTCPSTWSTSTSNGTSTNYVSTVGDETEDVECFTVVDDWPGEDPIIIQPRGAGYPPGIAAPALAFPMRGIPRGRSQALEDWPVPGRTWR